MKYYCGKHHSKQTKDEQDLRRKSSQSMIWHSCWKDTIKYLSMVSLPLGYTAENSIGFSGTYYDDDQFGIVVRAPDWETGSSSPIIGTKPDRLLWASHSISALGSQQWETLLKTCQEN